MQRSGIVKTLRRTVLFFLALLVFFTSTCLTSQGAASVVLRKGNRRAAKNAAPATDARADVIAQINAHIHRFDQRFTLQISDFSHDCLPGSLRELDSAYVDAIRFSIAQKRADGETEVAVVVEYDEGGSVLSHHINNTPLPENERTEALNERAIALLNRIKDKKDISKIVWIHDYVIKNVQLDTVAAGNGAPSSAYDALLGGKASDDGYAAACHLLYALAGIDSCIVYSTLNTSPPTPHLFNKVMVNGKCYNMDAFVDDQEREGEQLGVGHGYCLVSDRVVRQRYTWDAERYPQAIAENNWHHRKGLAADSQEELEAIVNDMIAQKKETVSIWIEEFAPKKFDFEFLKKNESVQIMRLSFIDPLPYVADKPFATELTIQVKYA